MSNSKLTAAQAARYWGCEVVDPATGIKGYLVGIKENGIHVDYGMGVSFVQFSDYIKLLLTPLSAITDEHAIEVAKVVDRNVTYGFGTPEYRLKLYIAYNFAKDKRTKEPVIERYDSSTGEMYGTIMLNIRDHKFTHFNIIDLLRSLGYDCDNAISEGWAVDKRTFDNK
jgi:hypothetical protein